MNRFEVGTDVRTGTVAANSRISNQPARVVVVDKLADGSYAYVIRFDDPLLGRGWFTHAQLTAAETP